MNWITNTVELVKKTKSELGDMLASFEDSLQCPPPSDIVVDDERITLVWEGAAGSVMCLRVWKDKYTIHYSEYGTTIDIAKTYQFKAVREFASKGYFFMHHDWVNDALLPQSLKTTILRNPDEYLINKTMNEAVHNFIEMVGCTIKPDSISVKSPYVIELIYRGKILDDSALVTFTVDKDVPTTYLTTVMHLENEFLPMDEKLFLTNFSLTKGIAKNTTDWANKYIVLNGGIVPLELRDLTRLEFPTPSESSFCTLTRSHVLTWRIDHKKSVTFRMSSVLRNPPGFENKCQLHVNGDFESLEAVSKLLKLSRLDTQQGTYLTV